MAATHQQAAPQSPSVPLRFISPRELAQRWCVGRSSVDRIAQRAHITRYVFGKGRNGSVRYRLDEVERFEAEAAAPHR